MIVKIESKVQGNHHAIYFRLFLLKLIYATPRTPLDHCSVSAQSLAPPAGAIVLHQYAVLEMFDVVAPRAWVLWVFTRFLSFFQEGVSRAPAPKRARRT
jgi:hypothetical protein